MIDIAKLLAAVETASAAYRAALDIVEDVAAVVAPADQAELASRLATLRNENDEGHARLQAKLAAIIVGGR
jgi:hypothetical protein